MLNKLRIKFIGISLTLFAIVLITFFTISFNNASLEIQKNSISILNQISKNYGRINTVYHTKSNMVIPPNFTVFLDDDSKIIDRFTVSNPSKYIGTDISLIQKLTDLVLLKNEKMGIIKISDNLSLRYLIVDDYSVKRVTFLSKEYEDLSINHALDSARTNTFYLTIILLLTTVILSIWTFKPVKKALDQQNQFLADASHELRTPLTAMQANLDVVLAYPEKKIHQQMKWFQYIKDELSRMKILSNDLLQLTKYKTHEQIKYYQTIDLSQLVSSTVLSLESLAFESNKTLEYNTQENIYIQGDSDKLKQLVMILIDNAIKYAPPLSKIEIILKKSGTRVNLMISNEIDRVVDTNKIFNRFYREDNSRNRQNGGSGLGLSIAKNIIESHKGKIFAKSTNEKLYMHCHFPISKK